MNRLLSILGAIVMVAMFSAPASAQQWGRRGGTGYDGGAQSAGQAHYFANVYGRYPNPYKGGSGCMPYYNPPCYNGGGGCGPGYGYSPSYGRGTSVSVGVSYQSSRYGGSRGSSFGVGVGFQTSSYGGNRATNVGVNLAYSGSHWGRRR